MKNKWIWALVGLLILSFVVIGVSSKKNTGGTSTETVTLAEFPITSFDSVLGNRDAKVVIVEYADFQCPACKIYSSLLKQTVEAYKGEVAVVYRHYPLIEIHSRAIISAKAAEAAGMQGKFFEMANSLYENQEEWVKSNNPEKLFSLYASVLKLDIKKFESDMKLQVVEEKIAGQRLQAKKLNLSGTPSLFVNGKLIPLPQSGAEFQQVINTELQNLSR